MKVKLTERQIEIILEALEAQSDTSDTKKAKKEKADLEAVLRDKLPTAE